MPWVQAACLHRFLACQACRHGGSRRWFLRWEARGKCPTRAEDAALALAGARLIREAASKTEVAKAEESMTNIKTKAAKEQEEALDVAPELLL